jgi:hypothetical protein
MRRSRARLGLGAIVMALIWPAAPAAASTGPADAGTLQVSPGTVQAAQETTLVFSFTAPASPPSQYLTVTLPIPAGWTVSAPSPANLACQDSGCQRVASGTQIAVAMRLYLATAFTLDLQATAPGSAAPASFTAVERFRGPAATLQVTAPAVTVSCPQDETGSMTVDPATDPAASSRTCTFTYTAGGCGAGPGGVVAVPVPPGWTTPDTQPGAPGFVTWAGGSPVSVSGSMITVPAGDLEPGAAISFEYESAQSPGSPGSYTFTAGQSGADGPLEQLASSPVVTVTPSAVTPPPPPPAGGAGTMTVTPARVTASHPAILRFMYTAGRAGLPSSGEVTVQVPAGWTAPARRPGRAGYASASSGLLTVSGRQIAVTAVTLRHGQQLTLTYSAATAPGTAGTTAFVTSQRPDGTATLAALTMSPQVVITRAAGTRGQPASWRPILLIVIGLVLIAGTAGHLAVRTLRRGGHGAAAGSVQAVPRAGPPPSLTVRDTGDRTALTVRIEPRAGAVVTTIKESQP